jgi:uncharacterized protein
MKIALIGATGFVGSAILKEALDRGHEVTAIVRNPDTLTPHEKLRPMKGDVYNEDEVVRLVAGHDAVSAPSIRDGAIRTSTASRSRARTPLSTE